MESFLYEKSKLLSPKLCNKWIETYNKSNLGRKVTALEIKQAIKVGWI